MKILAAFFGVLSLLSAIALVRFHGNPLFLFSLLLSAASLLWLLTMDGDEPPLTGPARARPRNKKNRKRTR